MTLSVFASVLALLIPPVDQDDLITPDLLRYQPYVELFAYAGSVEEIPALRATIERERDQEIEAAKSLEEEWEKNLAAARENLEALNKLSSQDSGSQAKKRSGLHIEIAALERGIREKRLGREQRIPAKYELQLTRLWLAQHWPERRARVLERVRQGQSRDRSHGDVEDVGYRKLAGKVLAWEDVEGVRVMNRERGVMVETRSPDAFYSRLPQLSLEADTAIKEVYSDDDNLEAVFKYLVTK